MFIRDESNHNKKASCVGVERREKRIFYIFFLTSLENSLTKSEIKLKEFLLNKEKLFKN